MAALYGCRGNCTVRRRSKYSKMNVWKLVHQFQPVFRCSITLMDFFFPPQVTPMREQIPTTYYIVSI